LDYFGARYFSGAQGRFTSPDPILSSGRPDNPQTWNQYAYVLNNPLRYTDPYGLYEFAGCQGSEEECIYWQKVFNDGVKNAQKALKSNKLTDSERADLEEVLAYLGTAGDGNKVRIAFGEIEGAWGTLAGENKIKIDMKALVAESKKDHFGYKELDSEIWTGG
jgi:uncharacterized protein RhaS with RHS repeats